MMRLAMIASLVMLPAMAAEPTLVDGGIDDSSLYDKSGAPIAREVGEYQCAADGPLVRVELAWKDGSPVDLVELSIDGGAVSNVPDVDVKAVIGRLTSLESKGVVCKDGKPVWFGVTGWTGGSEASPGQVPLQKFTFIFTVDPDARLITGVMEY
ncbi:MAG: hypothetical protein QM698_03785 [Micropepsaceae bacterium]